MNAKGLSAAAIEITQAMKKSVENVKLIAKVKVSSTRVADRIDVSADNTMVRMVMRPSLKTMLQSGNVGDNGVAAKHR
ncbi:hypothetical protein, partial [Roseiconus lacunae]